MSNDALSIAASAIMAHLNLVDEQKPKIRKTEAQKKKRIAQAKDIPDVHLVQLIKSLGTAPTVFRGTPLTFYPAGPSKWVMVYDICRYWNVIPENVIRAKLKKMVYKGFIDGCWCGCRGDFYVLPKGEELLAEYTKRE
jgi:hypothetical protein